MLPSRVIYNQNGITSFLTKAPTKKKIILLFKQGVRKYIIYPGFDLTTWIRIHGIKYSAVLIFEYKSYEPSLKYQGKSALKLSSAIFHK